MLYLYGWEAARLPAWFTERFPAEYHRKRLFDEQPDRLLHVTAFEKRDGAPQVAAPERALLEMLSEVGVRQPLQEARELVESCWRRRKPAQKWRRFWNGVVTDARVGISATDLGGRLWLADRPL